MSGAVPITHDIILRDGGTTVELYAHTLHGDAVLAAVPTSPQFTYGRHARLAWCTFAALPEVMARVVLLGATVSGWEP